MNYLYYTKQKEKLQPKTKFFLQIFRHILTFFVFGV